MKFGSELLREQRVFRAMNLPEDAPEYLKVSSIDTLSGGQAHSLMAKGRSATDILSGLQTAIRDDTPMSAFSEKWQNLMQMEEAGDFEGMLKAAKEWDNSGVGALEYVQKQGVEALRRIDFIRDEALFEGESAEDIERYRRVLNRDGFQSGETAAYQPITDPHQDAANAIAAANSRPDYDPTGGRKPAKAQILVTREDYEWAKKFDAHLRDKDLVRRYKDAVYAENLPLFLPQIKAELSEVAGSIIDSAVENGMKWDDTRWEDFKRLPQEERATVASTILMLQNPTQVGAVRAAWRNMKNQFKAVTWDWMADTGGEIAGAVNRNYQNEVDARGWRRQMLQEKFADMGPIGNTFAEFGGIIGYMGPTIAGAALSGGGSIWAKALRSGAVKGARMAAGAATAMSYADRYRKAARAVRVGQWMGRAGRAVNAASTWMMAGQMREDYLQRIANDGGDVTNPLTQLAAATAAYASACVEHIQWEQGFSARAMNKAQIDAYSKIAHSVFGKAAAKYGIKDVAGLSMGHAVGIAMAERGMSVFYESLEEAIQQSLEEVVVQVGEGKTLRLGEALGASAEAFGQSLGPMLWMVALGSPFKAAGASLHPVLHSAERVQIHSAADRVRNWFEKGEWDATWNRDKAKQKAVRTMSVVMAKWGAAENDLDALNTLSDMGFSGKEAVHLDGVFRAIRQDAAVAEEKEEDLLPEALRAENPIDVMANAAEGKMGKDMGVSEDGKTFWRDITIGGKTVRLNTTVERLASDMADEDLTKISRQRASSFIQSMLTTSDKRVPIAMQAAGLNGKTADEIVASDELLAKAQAIKATLDLRDIGGAQTTDVRHGADGQVTEVNVDVTLDPSAFRGTVRHESVHVIEEVLKAVGISQENAKKLARSAVRSAHLTERQNRQLAREGASMAPKGENETWNEEMAPIVAELMRTESDGPLVDAAKWAWKTAKGLMGLQKRQQASRTAVDFFVNAMRTGHIEDLDSLTFEESASDAILREVEENGPKAEETTAEVAAEEARQDAAPPNAGETPAPPAAGNEDVAPPEVAHAPAQGDQAPTETAPEMPQTHIDPSAVARKVMAHDAVTLDEMAALKKAAPDLTTGMAWARGYVFNPNSGMWVYDAALAGKRDERDAPQRSYVGIDGQQHDPAAERAKGDESDLAGHDALEARQEADDFFEEEMDAAADAIRQLQEQGQDEADAILQYIRSSGSNLHPRVAAELRNRLPDARMRDEADKAMERQWGEVHFMLRSFSDGTQFVEIEDIPANIRNETDPDKLRVEVAKLIRQKWMNQIIDPQGVRVFVNGRTAQEYAYPAKDIDGDILRAKMDAAGKLNEVVSTSAHPRAVPDGKDGHVHPNVKEWEHRDAIFHVNERYYGAIVNIAIVEKVGGTTGNFRLLKDVTQIKDITDEVRNLHGDPIEGGQSYPSTVGDNASQTPTAPDVNSENSGRDMVAPRLPSPEFAMDGTIADALPAHLREDARAIIAERAGTPAWMVEPDGTPTELNDRDWLRREAETRHGARNDPLIAVHGMQMSNLLKVIDEGAFIIPSIALVRVDKGWTTPGYASGWGGNAFVFFDRDVVDSPKTDRFSDDALTTRTSDLNGDFSEEKIARERENNLRNTALRGRPRSLQEARASLYKEKHIQEEGKAQHAKAIGKFWTISKKATKNTPFHKWTTEKWMEWYRDIRARAILEVKEYVLPELEAGGVTHDNAIALLPALRDMYIAESELRGAMAYKSPDIFEAKPWMRIPLGKAIVCIDKSTDQASKDKIKAAGFKKVIETSTHSVAAVEEAERKYAPRFAISGLYTGSAADYAQRDEDGNIVNGPSLNYVGTGDGTAAFGYGLYSSAMTDVANYYADEGKREAVRKWEQEHDWLNNPHKHGTPEFFAWKYLCRTYASKNLAIKEVTEDFKRNSNASPKTKELFKATIKAIRASDMTPPEENGYLYEQTFFTNRATPEETERHLLKWYETVPEEQLDWVAKQWKKEKLDSGAYTTRGTPKKGLPPWLMDDWRAINHHTGEELYKRLQYYFESAKAASDFLARAGIDGVKMPVNGFQTGGASDGNVSGWNYVSFRDDNIRVDHKWVNGERRYQIAGRAGAERLGIRGLGDAEAMERSGATREEIWRETGWWRGKDGEWRVEIGDIRFKRFTESVFPDHWDVPPHRAFERLVFANLDKLQKMTLGERITFLRAKKVKAGTPSEKQAREIASWVDVRTSAEELLAKELKARDEFGKVIDNSKTLGDLLDGPIFDAYPGLKNVRLEWKTREELGRYGGWAGIDYIAAPRGYGVNLLSTLSHEIAHHVQRIEGLTPGSHPQTEMERIYADRLYESSTKQTLADLLKTLSRGLKVKDVEQEIDRETRIHGETRSWSRVAESVEQKIKNKKLTKNESEELFCAIEDYANAREYAAPHREIRDLSKAADEAYMAAGGEVEARMVEARLALTDEQRKEIPPWVSEAVVRQDTISERTTPTPPRAQRWRA